MSITWEKIISRTGLPTVKIREGNKEIYLHSKYDPLREAEQWVKGWTEMMTGHPQALVVIGLGLGYHVHILAEQYPDFPITVWEFNPHFYNWIKEQHLLRLSERVKIYCSENIEEIKNILLPLLLAPENMVFIHNHSLALMSEALSPVKKVLESYLLQQRAYKNQKKLLEENFAHNLTLNDPGLTACNKFINGSPVLLVSAGPSLTKQLSILKEIAAEGSIKIATVGTALKPLVKAGIIPDLVMISDPNEKISEQFNVEINLPLPPLFYLSTANHSVVASYQGPRYIVWQKGFAPAELEAEKRNQPLILTGGSVATCLLDLLVKLGASSVGLVGQDLAYTDGYSHAADTVAARQIIADHSLLWVDGYDQRGKVPTSLNLFSYLKWFENYALMFPGKELLWNCTEGGAYIPGWRHEPLASYWRFALRRRQEDGRDL
ncbi:Protein of unknown function DUF115 [Carboxydocella sporoproducens DSM 16521]|uniref:6-hydroxymethylpterin diphosphokinase MptE-like domain-containing protein n=2 Tax=Carboxydocella TaxID=178898 RepID=A0A1T4QW72_9FIRM|nr:MULTISPECIES: 6-hydroxymethylpterin diphosphokinase MptE-like protein [Carboxydocella]AVX21684.1 Protein of unknown function DUF115 [Carboxydocella thermautotrophica]AVX32095.1 Protein of unknown function DUF115 [Carboxydocella thermautotrophica]SKA07993.1 Protein of unknown function DUF115 [Carboxydocella sporoproducens DSM 16521]